QGTEAGAQNCSAPANARLVRLLAGAAARRPERSELLAASLRFQGVDDRADVLGALPRNDQQRVVRIDDAEAAKAERSHQTAAFGEHDAVIAVDGERVAAQRVPARVEGAHFGKR